MDEEMDGDEDDEHCASGSGAQQHCQCQQQPDATVVNTSAEADVSIAPMVEIAALSIVNPNGERPRDVEE